MKGRVVMLMSVLSSLIVSVDALFIGLSLGLQKSCRFVYLAVINGFLLTLCIAGFVLAGHIYEIIPIEPDLIVGLAFISLGLWSILQYIIFGRAKRNGEIQGKAQSRRTIVLIGLVMSVEAMMITMGITFIFQPYGTIAIPVAVAAAHFGYSALTFYLARTKRAARIPTAVSHAVSGLALIAYGFMALFVDFGM